jgi:hypothetical protein
MSEDEEKGATPPSPDLGAVYQPPSLTKADDRFDPPLPPRRRPGAAGDGAFWGSVVRSGLALIAFFALGGLGFIFGGYAMYYAIKCHRMGNDKGWLAIGIAGLSLAAVLVGWMVRLSEHAH